MLSGAVSFPGPHVITTTLFDIDGTLLHGRPIAHGLAMVEGLNQAFGLALTEADLLSVDLAGKTDLHIANDLLDHAGVGSHDRESGLRRWCVLAAGIFAEIADRHDDPIVAPDAAATLAVLRASGLRTSLVTGNIEDIAHAKMSRAGLGDHFPRGHGGFGCDSTMRAEIVGRALERGGVSAREAVVIGDTPRDIAAARGAGCRVVAVATGFASAHDLADADAVVAALAEVPPVLERWRRGD
ncbi:MAG: HAD family hydrolase [Thermoleophilia bacterium]